MTIHVTQEHIEQGRRNDCRRCPIALAIAPYNKARLFVQRGFLAYDRFDCDGIELPGMVMDFIIHFDARETSWSQCRRR